MDAVDIIDDDIEIDIRSIQQARQGEFSFAEEVGEVIEEGVKNLKDQGVVSVERDVDISKEKTAD